MAKNFLSISKYIFISFFGVSLVCIISLRFYNPPFTSFIVSETNFFKKNYSYEWTPIEKAGKNILLALVSTEDAKFCRHMGFDWSELYKVISSNEKRGASTISQQVIKNLFLWSDRSYIRKGIEAYFTLLLEILVPKKRILEIYINVIETAPLSFGVNSLSLASFSKTVGMLNKDQALRIALVLPNPKKRDPLKLKSKQLKRISKLKKDMIFLENDGRSSCFF
tara:strand:- start:611 stop:1279 length:669 start_codon:yes stop_codon:yes gene_type:complete